MSELSYRESILVACAPEKLYDLVSDVTRMGRWSPICAACWWDEGGGPRVGAWFTGRNETPERTWETRAQVVAADRGHEFAFEVNNGFVRWGYTFTPAAGGTELTESWKFLPKGIAGFHDRYGDDAEAQIAERTSAAHSGIPVTLAAIKRTAESADSRLPGPLPSRPGHEASRSSGVGVPAFSAAVVMLRSMPPNTTPWNGEIDRQ